MDFFAQLTADSPYSTVQRAAPFPSQNRPFAWGILCMVCEPNEVHTLNGILIGLSVFEGLTITTDQQTDRPTDHASRSVTIDNIYVRSTTMRPNN